MLFGAAVGGCGFNVPAAGVPDGDGGIDGHLIDVPLEACIGWHPHHFDPCMIPAPTMDLDLSMAGTYTLDTTAATLQSPAGSSLALIDFATTIEQGADDAFLISVRDLNVGAGATLRVVGGKPLIVASWNAIVVAGGVDAGSHLAITDPLGSPNAIVTKISAGAGANPVACSGRAPTNGGDGVSGTGGGGGGGNRGAGGTGGKGDTNGANPGGLGGGAVASPPTIVYGGCTGGVSGKQGTGGGPPSTPTTTSPGGPGGGAVQLTARNALSITGSITAGGAGGGGAQRNSGDGGGGGGAGGFIGLDAPAMSLAGGTLAANGGAGGTSAMFTGYGHEGQDGKPSAAAAIGGHPDDTCSLDAPSGSAAGTLVGGSVSPTAFCSCGGAGGGGGAGFILVWGTLTTSGTTTVSPMEQSGPP
jgi:hypothetical protein